MSKGLFLIKMVSQNGTVYFFHIVIQIMKLLKLIKQIILYKIMWTLIALFPTFFVQTLNNFLDNLPTLDV